MTFIYGNIFRLKLDVTPQFPRWLLKDCERKLDKLLKKKFDISSAEKDFWK